MLVCGIVKKELDLDKCFVENCMWRDKNHNCRYTDKSLSVEEFCKLMEIPVPSQKELKERQKKLQKLLSDIN